MITARYKKVFPGREHVLASDHRLHQHLLFRMGVLRCCPGVWRTGTYRRGSAPILGTGDGHLIPSFCDCVRHRHSGSYPVLHVRAFSPVGGPTMPFAYFCTLIPTRCRAGSTWQADRPPRVMRVTFPLMPAAYTSMLSVQVSGFEGIGLLAQHDRLVCDSCSSSQRFACGFLQIPPRDGHPCRPANSPPCRATSKSPAKLHA